MALDDIATVSAPTCALAPVAWDTTDRDRGILHRRHRIVPSGRDTIQCSARLVAAIQRERFIDTECYGHTAHMLVRRRHVRSER